MRCFDIPFRGCRRQARGRPAGGLARVAACAVLLALPGVARASSVPPSFVGVSASYPLIDAAPADAPHPLDLMVSSGVQSFRTPFYWALAQPYERMSDVPPDERDRYRDEGGVPTDYTQLDAAVTTAAERRLTLLPVVLLAPRWDARQPGVFASPPRVPQPYADFMAALVRRYGPGGAFWTEHPELVAQPIRRWQIWNEPSLTDFWSRQPFAPGYVKLLRHSRRAIKAADPGAAIVLGGLPNKSWDALDKVYRAGGRGLFDVAAFHPFTATVSGVKTILEKDREVMARNGDRRKPLWITELSWTSAKGKTTQKFGFEETPRGQAKKLTAAYRMLAKLRHKLRVHRVYWYTWITRDASRSYPFDYAGLLRLDGDRLVRKPAFGAFRKVALGLQGCQSKRGRADRCAS
jgi:polysaccharide biosynthesis protein PslG